MGPRMPYLLLLLVPLTVSGARGDRITTEGSTKEQREAPNESRPPAATASAATTQEASMFFSSPAQTVASGGSFPGMDFSNAMMPLNSRPTDMSSFMAAQSNPFANAMPNSFGASPSSPGGASPMSFGSHPTGSFGSFPSYFGGAAPAPVISNPAALYQQYIYYREMANYLLAMRGGGMMPGFGGMPMPMGGMPMPAPLPFAPAPIGPTPAYASYGGYSKAKDKAKSS